MPGLSSSAERSRRYWIVSWKAPGDAVIVGERRGQGLRLGGSSARGAAWTSAAPIPAARQLQGSPLRPLRVVKYEALGVE